jgi:hypothetical protein
MKSFVLYYCSDRIKFEWQILRDECQNIVLRALDRISIANDRSLYVLEQDMSRAFY